jgi:hypothetical protein
MSAQKPSMALSPDYHTAIGVITVNGAIMDQLIDTAIWLVLKMPPERGMIVTGLLANTSRKITFLRDLVAPMISDGNLKKEFHDVFSKLKSAQANRSKIVHAKWVFKASDRSIHIEVPPTEETPSEAESMPLARLQGYGREIAQAHKALEDFFLKVEISPAETGTYTWPPRFEGRPFRPKKS